MRRALGTAVFSGMLGVTFFGIFLTPVFFYVIDWFAEQHLFSLAALRRIGRTMGDMVTLGFLRRPIGRGFAWLKAAFKAKPKPEQPRRTAVAVVSTNGNGSNGAAVAGTNGNGAVHSHPDEPLVASEAGPPT
jgi:multidrug efflux pump